MESYKTFVLDKRHEKTTTAFSTAKKQDEDIAMGEFFPPEGSAAVFVKSEREGLPEVHGVFHGGARYMDQIRTTGLANNLCVVDFSYDSDVVFKYSDITVIPPVRMALDQKVNSMLGSTFQGLKYSKSLLVEDKEDGHLTIHVFGGQSFFDNKTKNDLYVISSDLHNVKTGTTDCTLYRPAYEPEEDESEFYGFSIPKDAPTQNGDIPCGRTGHTWTMLKGHKKGFLLGGISVVKYGMPGLISEDKHGLAYIYDCDSVSWDMMDVEENLLDHFSGMAFHSATLLSNGQIAVQGGIVLNVDGHKKKTHSIFDVVLLNVNVPEKCVTGVIVKFLPEIMPNNFSPHLSEFATCVHQEKLVLYGGVVESEAAAPKLSEFIVCFDFENRCVSFDIAKTIQDQPIRMNGCHLYSIIEDTILICGSDCYMIYTKRVAEEVICNAGKKCQVFKGKTLVKSDRHPCDTCKLWVHHECDPRVLNRKAVSNKKFQYTCLKCRNVKGC